MKRTGVVQEWLHGRPRVGTAPAPARKPAQQAVKSASSTAYGGGGGGGGERKIYR
jgi:hypothetical protein